MSNTNPIPLRTLPHFNEASAQRSLRDSDAVPRQWKKNSQTNAQIRSVSQNVHHIQRQIDRMRFYKGSGTEPQTIYYPFKVIPSPVMSDADRAKFTLTSATPPGSAHAEDAIIIAQGGGIPLTEDIQWRTFRVRAGRIGDGTGTAVLRTDGANQDPDDTTYNPSEAYSLMVDSPSYSGIDFTVPDNTAAFYVYAFRNTSGAWYIVTAKAADVPTITWGDGTYILIASINTLVHHDDRIAVIRQYVRTDLMEPAIVCNPYA